MSRILRVGFQQAIRSIILILLPVGFISLVAWATAGSSSGNTADPLRATLWFFLIAHQVPLQLSLSDNTIAGGLTFLPLGALVIPFYATRSGYLRMVAELGEPSGSVKRNYILSFAASYSVIGYSLSLFALGGTVRSSFYIAIPIIFLISAISAFITSGMLPRHSLQFPWQRAFRVVTIALAALLGISSILLAVSLAIHFDVVLKLTKVVEPGIFGGLVLLLVQILYLPNVVIASLSYIAGSGVTIGQGSWLSPLEHRIDEIPAIPILGGLPVQSAPILILLTIFIIATGILIARYGVNTYRDESEARRFYLATVGISLLLVLILARASSGQLLSANLPSIGPLWWAMPIVITLELALGGALFLLTPHLINRARELKERRKNRESEKS